MGRIYLILLLLVLPPHVQAAEATSQIVVIKSNVAPFTPGRIINSAERLSLSPGEHIVAVASDGQVIKLAGPYSGPAGRSPEPEKSGSIVQTISNLMKPDSADRNSLAVTRQWPAEQAPPDPWAMQIALRGPHCVLETRPVSIWRSSAEKESSIRLSRTSDGRFADSIWLKGENSAPWPSGIEITSGQTYRAKISESREEMVFEIFVAPRDLPTAVHRAAWIAERGCRRQARMLLEKAATE